jgi:signal transduction histidine kinase
LDEAARDLASGADREFRAAIHALEVLAESDHLNDEVANPQQLRSFHALARRVLKRQPTWLTIILLTPDGRQVVNTLADFGQPLPHALEPGSLQRVIQTQQPAVGDLTHGRLIPKFGFTLRVPVIRDGRVRYVLSAVLTNGFLRNALAEEIAAEGEWTRALVDSKGIVAARSREPERFVGKPATPAFLERIRREKNGVIQSKTLDGVEVYTGFHELHLAKWMAVVSIPVQVIEAPQRTALAWIWALGAVLLFISLVGAGVLSRRIAQPIAAATRAAEALAKGETPVVENAEVREVAALGAALQTSSQLLQQHEQERSKHLAAAEAARQEAEDANLSKDHFLAALSHELRSPLTAILGWAAMIRAGELDQSTLLKSIDTIERNARSLAALVDDLLDMSSITASKVRLDIKPLDLAEVVCNATDSIRPTLVEKKLDLDVNIEASPLVNGDALRLQQVVWNLLSNAVKFTPAGGQIHVQLLEENRQAVIRVSDNGIGIAPQFLPVLFEKFQQAENGSTRKFGGLGLGLALVRSLVELHGGTVEAHSDGEGKGTTFVVKLPKIKQRVSRENQNAS